MTVMGKALVCGLNALHVATSEPLYAPGGVRGATAKGNVICANGAATSCAPPEEIPAGKPENAYVIGVEKPPLGIVVTVTDCDPPHGSVSGFGMIRASNDGD